MRRTDREITDRGIIDEFLHKATVIYIGLSHNGKPYVVPMNFGYDGENIYLHSAQAGKKIEAIQQCAYISFTAVAYDVVVPGEKACNWSAKYQSIMGGGTATFVNDEEEKKQALDYLMNKFDKGPFEYQQQVLARVTIIKIKISEISGKQAGY
jgi:nitroimidazol reductase NimA-like FMN-containing flavoprotein (pyridoxamine 5'-phosphate oxidase superfamily)